MGYYKDNIENGYQPTGEPCTQADEPSTEETSKPNLTEALEEVLEKTNKILGEHLPIIDFESIGETYSGVMRLPYSPIGAWNDVFNILATNGYRVEATVEPPTETERNLDEAESYIIIAFDEVE